MSIDVFMRLMKQQSGQPDRMTIRPWRTVMPLLGTLAVATILTAALPTKADLPGDKPAITVQAQTQAPEAKETHHRKASVWDAIAGTLAALVAFRFVYGKDAFKNLMNPFGRKEHKPDS
jgi:hypothetical protein